MFAHNRLMLPLVSLLAFLLLTNCPGQSFAAEWSWADNAVLRTATVEEGQAALSKNDVYTVSMSPFDLAVRLKTTEATSREAYLRMAAGEVREFTEEDDQRLNAAMKVIQPALARWTLPWPQETLLIKTTSDHEAGAAYCRGPVIVLPVDRISENASILARLLAHELFHVLSNQNPELRHQLYAAVGFAPCGEVPLPASLAAKKITNPDAPSLNYAVALPIEERDVTVIPILYAEPAKFDPQVGTSLFKYLQFRLLAIKQTDDGFRPVLDDAGEPVLYNVNQAPGYFDRVGRNTRYVIHPEEVLADNFVLLVHGETDVPTPDLLEKLDAILKKAAPSE